VPAEGSPLVCERLETEHLARWAVGLLVVDVDQANQVVQAMVRRGHRPFPGGALVQFAVRHRVVDEGGVLLLLQAERHAHADHQALPQRAAGNLHAGRVGGHPGHGQAAVVAAVGLEFAFRHDACLDQGCIEGDGVVAVGEQEAVTALPLGFVGTQAQRMAVGHRQHVGVAERLTDIALALDLAHAHGIAADPIGAAGQFGQRLRGNSHWMAP